MTIKTNSRERIMFTIKPSTCVQRINVKTRIEAYLFPLFDP